MSGIALKAYLSFYSMDNIIIQPGMQIFEAYLQSEIKLSKAIV